MCLNIGTPKNINFSFETNGKLMALGVPILKHIRVCPIFELENGQKSFTFSNISIVTEDIYLKLKTSGLISKEEPKPVGQVAHIL